MSEEEKPEVKFNSVILWLFGLFATVIITGGGAWMTVMTSRLNQIDNEQRESREKQGERLAKVEATLTQVEPRMQRIESKLDSMDSKIDLVLKKR